MTQKRRTPQQSPPPPPIPVIPTDDDPAPLDDAAGYDLGDRQINLGQLASEIKVATGSDVNIALSGTVLWIQPPDLDPGVLAQVVADHVPDPGWGIPNTTRDFIAAVQRLRAEPEAALSAADRDALLKGLALNFSSLLPQLGN